MNLKLPGDTYQYTHHVRRVARTLSTKKYGAMNFGKSKKMKFLKFSKFSKKNVFQFFFEKKIFFVEQKVSLAPPLDVIETP